MISSDPYDIYESTVTDFVFASIPADRDVQEYSGFDIYKAIHRHYDAGHSPYDTAIAILRVFAISWWDYLACSTRATMESDYKVNDLLEQIAGTKYAESEEDQIYETIQRLDYGELQAFLLQCVEIKETL